MHVLEPRIGVGQPPQHREHDGEKRRRQEAALDHKIGQKNERRRLDRGGQRQDCSADERAVRNDAPKSRQHEKIGQRVVGLPLEYREHEFKAENNRRDAKPCEVLLAPIAWQQPQHQFFGNSETADGRGDGYHVPNHHAHAHRHQRKGYHQEREGRRIAEQLSALAQRCSLQDAIGRLRVEGHADGTFGEAWKIRRCRHQQSDPGPVLSRRTVPRHAVPPCSTRNNAIPDGPANPSIPSNITISKAHSS